MARWIVQYTWHRSRYFDSILRNAVEREGFDTYREAREWADAEHPEIPGYRLQYIYDTYIPPRTDNYNTCVQRGGASSDRNTDVCIIKGNHRF